MCNRYETSRTAEGQFQPDSNNQVLLNKLGIVDPQEMENVELNLLDQLTDVVIESVTENQTISVSDLCEWHRRWLGNVYVWAGLYRSVNMGKGHFQFAAAHLIPKLMQTFESKFLSIYTPCNRMDNKQLVDVLAKVHIELILIHPFREGNGRLSRLLANVMALQAGQKMLDFSYLDNNKSEYFSAIQAGLDNAEPMKSIFKQVLYETQQNADG
jgi:cell filamentation protein